LEERLRARLHSLEWVDLRLGVATASQHEASVRESHVLKVCLDEVRRCRPFLVVVLGDRYGWVPPEDRIRTAAEEAHKGFSTNVAGRSVTDLEIEFGVFSDPEQQPRSIFYFRNPLPYEDMPQATAALYSDAYDSDPAAADRLKRLETLKGRIERQFPDKVRRYSAQWDGARQRLTGLEAWGRMVLKDLWSEFEGEIGALSADADLSWQQIERAALEDFVDDRARDFVGRQGLLSRLVAFAHETETSDAVRGICLTGDPGSGKSALFGALLRRLDGGEACVLAHAAGASVAAPSVDAMLRRWIGELADEIGAGVDLPDNAHPDIIDATFGALLARVAQRRRVIVLIDALDQFETTTRAQHLTWLPQPWPANARLVATTIAGTASQALAKRPAMALQPLPPLDAGEARDIIAAICNRYHRAFEPEIVEALLAKNGPNGPSWANPLWLVLAVEDLNVLDADDFARAQLEYRGEPAERLRALMLHMIASFPADIPALYVHIFSRAEALFGTALVRGFLGLIGISRAGWRESDFRALLPQFSGEAWDELQFAQLRRVFRGQMRRRGAFDRWDFNHAQMRAAVRAGMAARGAPEKRVHALIAGHLLSCPADDPLRISEIMVHLLSSEVWHAAAAYYGSEFLTPAEIQGSTQVLADIMLGSRDGAQRHDVLVHLLDASGIDGEEARNVTAGVANRFLFALNPIIEPRLGVAPQAVLANRVRSTVASLVSADPTNLAWRCDLAIAASNIGDTQMAQGDLAAALASYRDARAAFEASAQADPDNAGWQHDLSVASSKMGHVQFSQGDLTGAFTSYSDNVAICERLARANPADASWQRNFAVALGQIGEVQSARGDLAGALKSYSDSVAIFDRLAKADLRLANRQRDLSVSLSKLGDVQSAQGALQSCRASFVIREKLANSDPTDSGWQQDLSWALNKIGDLQKNQGDLTGALQSYRDSHAIAERLAQSDPDNAGWQREVFAILQRLAGIQESQGDYGSALGNARAANAITEKLVEADPGNARWQHDLSLSYDRIGDVHVGLRDFAAALKDYENGREIAERLVKLEPDNVNWQRGLSISHQRIGNLQIMDRDIVGARKSFRAGLAISQRLAESDPGNTGWQRDLAAACLSVARGDDTQEKEMLAKAAEIVERLTASGTLSASDSWIVEELAEKTAELPP
jgi:tetratricopeptide (TPR) repeat protein